MIERFSLEIRDTRSSVLDANEYKARHLQHGDYHVRINLVADGQRLGLQEILPAHQWWESQIEYFMRYATEKIKTAAKENAQ